MRKHNREYAEDFASHLLRVNRFDLKIAQDFHIKIKNTLQLNVNILNFGNLLNNSWGQTKNIAASNRRGDRKQTYVFYEYTGKNTKKRYSIPKCSPDKTQIIVDKHI